MERCIVCGQIETPLDAGVCPTCSAEPERLLPLHRPGRHTSQAPRPLTCAAPSAFLLAGLLAEAVGVALLFVAQEALSSPEGAALGIPAFLGLAVGGVLITVGAIRWAIWPLIEASQRD